MEKINKLSLPVTILLASIILGGFYYLTEANKLASVEKQRQIARDQANLESRKKADCVSEAQLNAVELNKQSCDRGEYCLKGEGMYLTGQYENSYKTCLQREGLQ